MTVNVEKIRDELADREAIRDLQFQYCRGIDRRDPDLVKSVFWPGATDDHGGFSGQASEMVGWAFDLLKVIRQTQHFLGNIMIRISGDTAEVETYFQAIQSLAPHDREPYDNIVCGRYLDRMEKRGSEWGIARREVVYDWYRDYEGSADFADGLNGMRALSGLHKPDDRIYQFFEIAA